MQQALINLAIICSPILLMGVAIIVEGFIMKHATTEFVVMPEMSEDGATVDASV